MRESTELSKTANQVSVQPGHPLTSRQPTQPSTWLPALSSISSGFTVAYKWAGNWYQRAKENVQTVFSEPEEPFYMKAQQNKHFARFQAWRDVLQSELREIKAAILSGKMNAVELGERLLAIQQPEKMAEHIHSPVMYSELLTQLEQDLREKAEGLRKQAEVKGVKSNREMSPEALTLTADVIQKVIEQLRMTLYHDTDLAEEYLESDLFNAMILYSGDRIKKAGLLTVLNDYKELVNNDLHQSLNTLIQDLPDTLQDPNDPNSFFDFSQSNRRIKKLFQNIQQAFNEYYVNLTDKDISNNAESELQTDKISPSYFQRFNELLKTAKDLTQASFHFVQAHPKVAMTTATSVAALAYVYYNTDRNSLDQVSQYYEKISQPMWKNFPLFSPQATNFLSIASMMYGVSILDGYPAAYQVPMLTASGLFWGVQLSFAQVQSNYFLKTVGISQSDRGYDVQVTTDENYIVTGLLNSGGSPGGDNCLLAKFDKQGGLSWGRALDEFNEDDVGYSVQEAVDGGYIAMGYTWRFSQSGAFLVKFNTTGNVNWARIFDEVYGIYSSMTTVDKNYIITGGYGFSGGANLLLAKLNETGGLIWASVSSIAGFDIYAQSVQQISDGGYIVTGWTSFGVGLNVLLAKFDGSGNLIWTRHIEKSGSYGDAISVRETVDRGYILTGGADIFGTGWYNLLLVKFNDSGNLIWGKVLGELNKFARGSSVIVTPDRGYIVTGFIAPGALLLAKFNEGGDLNWARVFSRDKVDLRGYSIQMTTDGSYIVTGWTDNTFGPGRIGFLLAKFDTNGNIPGCSFIQNITSNVVIQDITSLLNVNNLAITSQPVNLSSQSWNIKTADVTTQFQVNTECQTIKPETVSSASLISEVNMLTFLFAYLFAYLLCYNEDNKDNKNNKNNKEAQPKLSSGGRNTFFHRQEKQHMGKPNQNSMFLTYAHHVPNRLLCQKQESIFSALARKML